MYSLAEELEKEWLDSYENLYIRNCPEVEFNLILHRRHPDTDEFNRQLQFLLYLLKSNQVHKIGLSEVSLATLTMANNFMEENNYQIHYLETEASMVTGFVFTDGYHEYCIKNNIDIIAYSPTSRGLLSGKYSLWNKPKDTFRNMLEVWQPINFNKVYPALQRINRHAQLVEISTSQLAIIWLSNQDNCIPIPGYKNRNQLIENLKAQQMDLIIDNIHLSFDITKDHGIKRYL
jgi:aryl-alcohol dehydrogenase-like predicted oxidoreductase